MRALDLAPGFSRHNAAICCAASAAAYPPIRADVSPATFIAESPLAHVLMVDCGNALILAFRGTQNIRDVLTDLAFSRRQWRGQGMHHGFVNAFLSVVGKVEKWVNAQGISNLKSQISNAPLIITGHSLGGALAQLCAWALAQDGFPVHSVYTFGGPRAGNRGWAQSYDTLLGRQTFRLVNEEDIVPRMPPWLMGFRHTRTEQFFDALGFLHEEPGLTWKLISDGLGAWWDLRCGKIPMITDHPIRRYEQHFAN